MSIAQLHNDLKAEGQNATMIYVTHDQVEAMTLGDRICVLNQGRIMQVDTPMNLYQKPANKFVAGFIGSPAMNLMQATIELEGSQYFIILSCCARFLLPSDKSELVKSRVGKKVWFGIRPEHITVIDDLDDESVLQDIETLQINVVESMGNEVYLYLGIGKDKLVARVPFNQDLMIKHGDMKPMHFDMSHCHLFDIDTEQSLLV